MTPPFSLRTTSRYERLVTRLLLVRPELRTLQNRTFDILKTDPYNRSRTQHIKKLVGIPVGEGQRRLSLSRFRFRRDIYGREVVLHYCGLRREETDR